MNDEPNPPEDLVSRLRRNAEIVSYEDWHWLHPLLIEAADEIDRLRKAVPASRRARKPLIR